MKTYSIEYANCFYTFSFNDVIKKLFLDDLDKEYKINVFRRKIISVAGLSHTFSFYILNKKVKYGSEIVTTNMINDGLLKYNKTNDNVSLSIDVKRNLKLSEILNKNKK